VRPAPVKDLVRARAIARSRRAAGFTIVEVMLAMVILLIGATAVLGLLTFGATLTRAAQLRTAAASALDAVDADLEQVLFPFADGEVGEPVKIADRRVPGAPGVVYSAEAVQNPANPREYRVDVEMRWESGGVRRSRSFSQLRLRQIGFGERLRREFVEKSGGFRKTGAAGTVAD